MKELKVLKYLLLLIILFVRCEPNQEQVHELAEPLFEKFPLYDRTYEQIHFSPDQEFLEEIEDFLSTNQFFLDNQHVLYQHYGILMWSYAVMDVDSESNYLLSLPFVNNQQITGQLILVGDENHMDVYFVSTSTLIDLLVSENYNEIDGIELYALVKLLYLEYVRNSKFIRVYDEAISVVTDNFNSELEDRNYFTSYTWTTETYDPSTYTTTVEYSTIHSIIPCGGSGSGGGSDVTPPPGGGISVPTDEDDERETFDQSGLDIECINLLNNEASELLNEYANMIFPCEEESTQEILEQIIEEACAESSEQNDSTSTTSLISDFELDFDIVTVDDISEEINNFDWIIPSESFSSNAKINCIWQNIAEADSDLLCSTLNNFYGPSQFNINLYVQDLNGNNGTSDLLPSGNLYISLDADYINDACPIELIKTILHESIHTEILRRLNTFSIAELEQYFPEMMTYYNDQSIAGQWQHEYMADEWFDDLLDSVKDFYPGYTEEQYSAIVWSGLHNTNAFEENSGYTNSDLTNIRDNLRTNCEQCE